MTSSKPSSSQIIRLRVTPKARIESLKTKSDDVGNIVWHAHVRAPPENGKANEAALELLAKKINLPKSALTIIKGQTRRDKLVKIFSTQIDRKRS